MKLYWIAIAVTVALAAGCSGKKSEAAHTGMDMSGKAKDTTQMNGMDHSTMKGMQGMEGMDMGGKESMTDMAGMEGMNSSDGGELVLNETQMKLGGITVDTLRSGLLGDKMVLTATLNINQTKVNSVSSRVTGRIERLYYKNLGDYVAKGSRLFDLYSEELNNAKQEYILAIQRRNTANNSIIDFDQLIQGARNKLLLWGLNEAQIKELEVSQKATPTTTFYSNASGYITMLDIREGDYVMEGGTVVRLADLSTLWAEAQVYSSQLSQIDKATVATVQIASIPGLQMKGRIDFVNPELNPDTRINLVRVSIPNAGNRLKPGMPAYVFLNNAQINTTSLPIDAVIRGKDGAIVWVQTGRNTFRSRMVQVGLESGDRIEIKSGLKEGDVIVIGGVFWLNGEYTFKTGSNSMAGMNM